jgi:ArsR family transcriptional regulator, virulence genes transcriptional regulator
MQAMKQGAAEAAAFVKQLSHPTRLLVLCSLVEGEKAVGAMADELGVSQTALSNHLSRLRAQGLVDYRRDHRVLYYYLKDANVVRILGVLHDIFCKP